MDWFLIYRDEDQLLALSRELPQFGCVLDRIDRDPLGNITYLVVTKN